LCELKLKECTVYAEYLVSDKEEIAIDSILIWHYGASILDAKWSSNLVCKVSTFMVTLGVQNGVDVLNCEQKSGNPNDSYAVTITKKPIPKQTAVHY